MNTLTNVDILLVFLVFVTFLLGCSLALNIWLAHAYTKELRRNEIKMEDIND